MHASLQQGKEPLLMTVEKFQIKALVERQGAKTDFSDMPELDCAAPCCNFIQKPGR